MVAAVYKNWVGGTPGSAAARSQLHTTYRGRPVGTLPGGDSVSYGVSSASGRPSPDVSTSTGLAMAELGNSNTGGVLNLRGVSKTGEVAAQVSGYGGRDNSGFSDQLAGVQHRGRAGANRMRSRADAVITPQLASDW
jgi:hypothetical protein